MPNRHQAIIWTNADLLLIRKGRKVFIKGIFKYKISAMLPDLQPIQIFLVALLQSEVFLVEKSLESKIKITVILLNKEIIKLFSCVWDNLISIEAIWTKKSCLTPYAGNWACGVIKPCFISQNLLEPSGKEWTHKLCLDKQHLRNYPVGFTHWGLNTLRPRQNGRHFADDILKCIFLNENVWILIEISLKFVPKGPIGNIPSLV